ncbi:translocation/assembly module TamB domain-containing protein [Bdellovibrio bacteriovorus]
MKRAFWILITPIAGFLVLYLLGTKVVGPKLEAWTLHKVQSYSDQELPVSIRAGKLQLKLFKPSLIVEDIEIGAKGDLARSVQKVHIKGLRVFLDFFQLLVGKVKLSAVVVESPEVVLDIDPFLEDDTPPKELPIDMIFDQLEKLPLQRVFLQNLSLKVSSKKLKFATEIQSGDLLLNNMAKNITAKINLPALTASYDGISNLEGSLDSHLYLTRQSLRIIQLGLRLDSSELYARGELTRIKKVTIKPSGVLDISGKVNLQDLYQEIKKIRPGLKIPTLAGQVNLDVETRFDGLKNLRGKADLTTRAVVVDKFELGDARIQGDYQDNVVTLSELRAHHPAGEAVLTKSQITLDGNFPFTTKLHFDWELQKLFESLDLASIPVGMDLKADVPCEGQIYPSLQVTCSNVNLNAENLWVKSGMAKTDDYILELVSMGAKGQFKVTPQNIAYAAKVTVGNSNGTSDGVIDFAQGFKINFKTDKLDMKDIKNLSNLKIEGSASIDGSTSGDSQAAIFDMKMNAREFTFEGFYLGNLISTLHYRDGNLAFEDVAGAVNKTQYLGDLTVRFNSKTLEGDFTAPTADLNDIALIFSKIYELPVSIQGIGSAKAKVSGPLDFWKMNYQLQSAFKKVSIGPETFDQLQFNVSAVNGNMNTDKVQLTRGLSALTLQGGISSDQVMNLYADGKNWKLEESDSISKVNSNISGNLNFAAELKDNVKSPQILAKGAITDTYFEEQEIPNSNFIFRINRDFLNTQVSLFGDKVQSEFQYPFEKGRAPLLIKLNTNDWNFSSLLGLIGGINLANEYNSSLTTHVDLRSESGDLFKSSGKVTVQNLSLKRGTMSFANKAPIEIIANNGALTIRNFTLEGPQNRLQIRGEDFTADNLNVAVNLEADMRLLQIFLPFLEDLGGPINLSTTVSGKITKPAILGNFNANHAFIKIKGFPHPIERLSTEVVFSQSRIIINGIKAQIAGGTLTGDGSIQINGIKDLPTSIRLRMENVTFNVPDKIRTSGNADMLFSGRWFPFTLSGTYHVANALVEKEFTEDGGTVAGVKQSVYLPKVIREGRFEPVVLDLQIILDRNIIVKNSLLDGSVTGNIQVKGPPGNPVLLGRINMDRKSKLIFKDKIFEVQNGVVEFNDPNEINPNLYISAQSRIDEYDITLIAQGPAKNVGIRLTSIPPLPEQDIISLIALGVTSSTKEQNLTSRQQAEQLGVEIGGAVLAKPISKQLESTLGLNLQVTSEYDSTRNISVPKITLSRRLSERVKVSGSRPVGDNQSYDLKLEYLINNNITAVGSFENRGIEENTTIQTVQPAAQSIFGLDLEFKREFK